MINELFFKIIIGGIGITLLSIVIGLFYKGIDRKIAAHMQKRVGPPLRQPFRDVRKLMVKEPWNRIFWDNIFFNH